MLKKVITLFCCFVALDIYADAAKDLELKLSNIQSMDSKFTQMVVDELGSEVDRSSGNFQLQRPMKFRWMVESPYEQEIVSDGSNLWQFDRDIEQINVSTLSDSFANSPAALLSQSQLDMAQNYEVASLKGESENSYIYHLRPKSEDALFEVMVMEFNQASLMAFQVKDSLGQTTLVEFSEQKYNSGFAEDFFKFELPEGIDLIDSRSNQAELTIPPRLESNTKQTHDTTN